ncbi:MAG: DsbA family protein [Desulfuromonadales bacterium]|nr:DsbA family protein [Desulfuromonadales bacterium]
MRTDSLREEFDLNIRWSVFPLHPEIPEEGLELTELFAGRMDIDAVLQRLKRVSSELGLPIGQRTRTYNSRRAQELGKWAEEQGFGEAFHMAVYQAYFVDGRNIALPEELTVIAANVGLDAAKARQVVATQSYAAAVEADWQRAAELGITAVPTSIYNNQALVGFHPYAHYRRLITTTG